jgi:hypothetical protein
MKLLPPRPRVTSAQAGMTMKLEFNEISLSLDYYQTGESEFDLSCYDNFEQLPTAGEPLSPI